jgi:hypothetical protein
MRSQALCSSPTKWVITYAVCVGFGGNGGLQEHLQEPEPAALRDSLHRPIAFSQYGTLGRVSKSVKISEYFNVPKSTVSESGRKVPYDKSTK